jgi:hypothetical protein
MSAIVFALVFGTLVYFGYGNRFDVSDDDAESNRPRSNAKVGRRLAVGGSRAALAVECRRRQVHPRNPPPGPATVDSESGTTAGIWLL